jgi:hypothetical protein
VLQALKEAKGSTEVAIAAFFKNDLRVVMIRGDLFFVNYIFVLE